jgi:molecular chaperone GrpE
MQSDPGDAGVGHAGDEPVSVEDLVATLESVSTERDQYLDSLRRIQAEFENYKKAIAKRTADERERANDRIVGDLLPVLDACEGAVKNGNDDVTPVHNQLIAALERHGLERSDPANAPFDPELHEAVMHEPSDEVDEPTIAEVLRTGYLWKGRVLRPAMVRVKG